MLLVKKTIAVLAAWVAAGAFAASGEVVVLDGSFSPANAPEANARALQKALDGGGKTVCVRAPGEYRLDRTIYLDDDTTLQCASGVVFRKVGRYPQMLLNRKALVRGKTRNLVIDGLEIVCNREDMIQPPTNAVAGLRGHLGFVGIENVTIRNFKCLAYGLVGSCQYCLQFVDFRNVVVEDFDIRGGKDGIHFDYGRQFVVRRGKLRTHDDGIAINAGDWPGDVTPLIGSIEDGLVEDVEDLPGGKCNFARCITGVWQDWHQGIKLQRNDLVRVGRRIYCVCPAELKRNPDGSVPEKVSSHPPTHAMGVWKSPDGINFQFLQEDGNLRADLRRVTFRNCRLAADRGICCAWEINEYARLIHPEIPKKDYPVIDIRIENCVKETPTPLVYGGASAKIAIENVRAAGPLVDLWKRPENWPEQLPCPYAAVQEVTAKNCVFKLSSEGAVAK